MNKEYNLYQFRELLHGDFKCEVFQYNDKEPYAISYSKSVNTFIEDFSCWVDFPTIETFFRVFIDNDQNSFEKLWLDSKGDILTRIVFTKEN